MRLACLWVEIVADLHAVGDRDDSERRLTPELAVADRHWKIVERRCLTRGQFERWFANRAVAQVVMEACGSAHHWARWFMALGKSVEQQALQSLHRTRSLWMATRTARINALRGFCREFGIVLAPGARIGLEQIGRVLADPRSAIPPLLRATLPLLLEEIRLLEAHIAQLERTLTQAARESHACTTLLSVPGVGLLIATAMLAATGGSVAHFKSARHFAAWFGLTPKESSSGATRVAWGSSPNAAIAT